APILSTKEPKNSLSMGYEHLSITPETESDEVTKSIAKNLLPIPSECEVTSEDKREWYEHLSITPEIESDEVTKSNAKNLLPIPSECEVTSEDKRECDELVCDNHSDTFSDSKIDDDISVYDESFEDIQYVDTSVPDPAIVSIEEENVVHREEEEERLINLVENNNSDSSNDPLLEEVDLFLSDNSIPPGIENFTDDPEGDICFLEELLIDNSILSHESPDSNF
nr:hypothetical protein [Tanacetum cinerariifolium]